MARFFAALLAAAAMLQLGSAAPYPYTNGTAPLAPSSSTATSIKVVNSTVEHEVLKRLAMGGTNRRRQGACLPEVKKLLR
ncbi:hypothetical protein F4779DRAFT_260598 [Xylariaceae sp. FL0662B]|nr:hypothetical protein F4779DRAFT_260598 [Xylariaceae sp. FL0662B]